MENYHRLILALTDEELEHFTHDWINSKKLSFYEVTSFSGPTDMGRDIVVFLTSKKHEGPWHNYQCKQYRNNLPTSVALLEIGKILYFSFMGFFTPPQKYYFVAPRGINRNLETLIYKPDEMKKKLITEWNELCSEKIIDKEKIPLSLELTEFIKRFDFSNIGRITMNEMLLDEDIKSILFKWFGKDPGPAPHGTVPNTISSQEQNYIAELIQTYADKENAKYSCVADIEDQEYYLDHLKQQRIRFYDADAFKRFYRDNTDVSYIDDFEKEVFHGVIDRCNELYPNSFDRVNAVMAQAASLQTTGVIAKYTQITVKQGICHHFVNEKKMRWRNR